MATINLLDPSIGIQSVMDGVQNNARLPEARQLPSTVLSAAGLGELYAPKNAQQLIEDSLCPNVGDGKILEPSVFSGLLRDCVDNLKDSDSPEVRTLLEKELLPMLANTDLLRAYMGLMIGG